MGGQMSTTPDWPEVYQMIKTKHDNAFRIIKEGLTLEEEKKDELALEKYKEGISLIDEALSIPVACPEQPDSTWEEACAMVQKMKQFRAEVLMRINSLQNKVTPSISTEEISRTMGSASSVSSPSSLSSPKTYTDLAIALSQLKLDPSLEVDAEVAYEYEGVELYFISPCGEVTSYFQPQTLKITLLDTEGEDVPRAILQIGSWVYPLIPAVSPCYRTEYGAFIFPNIYLDVPGAAIGIILPADADASAYDILENTLHGIVGKVEPESLSERISTGIMTSASCISDGLISGAEKVSHFLKRGTPHLIEKIKKPEEPKEVPREVSKSMQLAEAATGKAARFTGYFAEKIKDATTKLGLFLAPHIEKQGTRLLVAGLNMPEEEAAAKVKGVMTVAAGAVEGFATIYNGLEVSSAILARSLRDNTVKVVNHKYGVTAGGLAADTLNAAGNVYRISQNVKIIHPKQLAKGTAKKAGKAVVLNCSSHNLDLGPSTSSLNRRSSRYIAYLRQDKP